MTEQWRVAFENRETTLGDDAIDCLRPRLACLRVPALAGYDATLQLGGPLRL